MNRWIAMMFVGIVALSGCEPAKSTWSIGKTTKSGNSSPRAKGEKDAKDAIAAGTLKLKEYPPLPSPAWQANYIKLLKDRCGVDYEVPSLPNGVAEADFREEVNGWNDVMTAEINKRFGANTVGKLHEEARTAWESHRKKK